MSLTKIGDFLHRSKIPVDIEDTKEYKRVTIRINHNGVSVRDTEFGKKIGTKKQFILKGGQFILSKIDARYGAFGIAPDDVDGAIITGNFWAYDVDKKQVNIEWLNQFTNSPDFYDLCERASSGITHRKYLDEKFFLNYEINLPTVAEQLKQIEIIKAQKVSFNELRTELTHQQDIIKQLRQAFLREAIQGKLTKQNLSEGHARDLMSKIQSERKRKKDKPLDAIQKGEIPFEIPNNWVWCRLGDLFHIVRGSSPRPKGDPRYFSKVRTKYHWITIADFAKHGQNNILKDTNQFLTEEGSLHSRVVTPNDLLIAASGVGSVGKSSKTAITGFIYDGIMAIKEVTNPVLISYLAYYLKVKELEVYDIASGANWLNINTDLLNNYLLPLPPLLEQERIVNKLDELMKYCDDLEQSIADSQAHSDMLLQQVLRESLQSKMESVDV